MAETSSDEVPVGSVEVFEWRVTQFLPAIYGRRFQNVFEHCGESWYVSPSRSYARILDCNFIRTVDTWHSSHISLDTRHKYVKNQRIIRAHVFRSTFPWYPQINSCEHTLSHSQWIFNIKSLSIGSYISQAKHQWNRITSSSHRQWLLSSWLEYGIRGINVQAIGGQFWGRWCRWIPETPYLQPYDSSWSTGTGIFDHVGQPCDIWRVTSQRYDSPQYNGFPMSASFDIATIQNYWRDWDRYPNFLDSKSKKIASDNYADSSIWRRMKNYKHITIAFFK